MGMVVFCDRLSRPCVIFSCLLSTLTLTATVMSASTQCFDRNGEPVNDGSKFYPQEDPCMMCICDNGLQIMCKAVACLPPQDKNCNRLEKVEDTCCDFKCFDPINNSTVVEDDSITNLGLRLVASTVTSFLVLALLLFVVHRLRQRRLLLAMRRFEIQARRQHLEETESDNHIPDFFGIECPPYEDPPPPYSSPKPSPRILAMEAPPPYEEVDHNQNGNQADTGDRETMPDRENNNRLQGVPRGHGTGVDQEISGQQMICRRSVMNEICQLVREHHQTRSARTNGPTQVGSEQELPQRNSPEVNADFTNSRRDRMSMDSSQSIPKLSENESFGQFCGSNESVHNCNCSSDQTLLKKSFSPENFRNDHHNYCSHKQSGQHTVSEEENCVCTRSSFGGQVQMCVPFDRGDQENRNHVCNSYNTVNHYSSLPTSLRNIAEGKRSDSVSNVGDEKNLVKHSTISSHFSTPLSCRSNTHSNNSVSQSCDPTISQQEEPSKSLPLDLPDNSKMDRPTALIEERSDRIGAPGMQKFTDNEHYKLRNLRLLNLWNDPVPRPESPESPVSTVDKNMIRSQSVNSEISLMSVCSETGEKRASRNAAKVLENDSQYPEIPVSAHAMRLTLESFAGNNVEKETAPQIFLNLSNNGVCESEVMSNDYQTPAVLNPSELNHEHFPSATRDEKPMKPRLNAIEENAIEMTNYTKPPAECLSTKQDATSQQNKQCDSSKHKIRMRKKEKQKQYRNSTGGIPAQKSKRQPSVDSVKKIDTVGEPTSIPNEKTFAVRGKPAVDPARKKSSKTAGCFKQYGFIDDPSHFQSQSAVKDDHQQEVVTRSPREHRHVSIVTKDSAYENRSPLVISKLGAKRQLTSADKSSYSPSPTRHKTSRPRSMVHASKDSSPVPENLNQHLLDNQNIPRRKLQSSRSKKRQSYPMSQNVQSSLDANSSVVMTPSSGVALQRIIDKTDITSKSMPNGAMGQPYPKGPEQGSSSNNPIGLITVRNGPLSSYV